MSTLTDAEREALVRRAIASARKTAGDDDRAFVRALRVHFFAAAPSPPLRRGGMVRARSVMPSVNGTSHIYDDPRYLRNARALALRTTRRLRIIGGSEVRGREFDDCVAVGDDHEFGCTGTLIAPDAVLTAGHCFKLHTRVFVGNDVTRRGRIFRVARRVRHPQYHRGAKNDLMLLVLARPVTGVRPRPIASTALIDAATDGRVVGFGNVDPAGMVGYGLKRQTDVPIASPACRGRVKGRSDRSVYGCDPDLELIAGKPMLVRDTCTGDSGGPFYVRGPRNAWLLAGATSRATDSAKNECGDGGVYARVDRYRDWIDSVLKG